MKHSPISRHGKHVSISPLRMATCLMVSVPLLGIAGVQSASAAVAPTFVTVTGDVPAFSSPGPVMVEVQAEPTAQMAQLAVGQQITFTELVPAQPVLGTAFSVAVPDSPELDALAQQENGNVNLFVMVSTPTEESGVFAPTITPALAATTASAATPASAAASRDQTLSLPPFPTPYHRNPGPDPACRAVVDSNIYNVFTKIGEMHVANHGFMEGTYIYHVQADSSVSIGFSTSINGPFNASGSVTISNSLGAGGTLPRFGPYHSYVKDHMDYQKWSWMGTCSGTYVQATHSAGDTIDGAAAPTNPWGSCAVAKNHNWGLATVPHGVNGPAGLIPGTWEADTSQAVSYDPMATLWAFNFSGHTGYTTNNQVQYSDYSTTSGSNICGTGHPAGASPIIYNETE